MDIELVDDTPTQSPTENPSEILSPTPITQTISIDFNHDGLVNISDYQILTGNLWTDQNQELDLNGDGVVDMYDINIFIYVYGHRE